MQPIQIVALSASLFHVAFLAGIYIALGGASTDTFVSAILDSRDYFKVLFSVSVVLEIAAAAAYIFRSPPPLSLPWACLAALSLFSALASWITVACSHSGTPWHFNGAGVFVVSSSIYTCFLIARARSHRWLYTLLLVADGACAAAFTALLLREEWQSSAITEWVTFFLQGIMFVFYYYETPIISSESDHTGQKSTLRTVVATQQRRQAEAARPLLVVVRGSSSSSSSSQQLVAAATPLIGGGAGAKGIRGLGAVAEEGYDEDEEQGPWGSRW